MNKTLVTRIGFFLFITVCCITLFYFCYNKSNSSRQKIKATPEGKEYLALMKDIVKHQDVSITFYGKIIDQQGKAVSHADITIEIPHFSSQAEYFEEVKTLHVKSDNKGCFCIRNQKGSRIYINDIKKQGYDKFSYQENQTNSFDLTREGVSLPDKINPAIFRLRKKQETTYLIHWENFNPEIFYGNATEEAWHLDLVRPTFRPAHLTNLNVNYGSKPIYTDVAVHVFSNQAHRGYNIIFSVPDISGGILETNVLMYTAPESGYQTNLVYYMPIIDKEMFETNTFFYIKARGGRVYARMNASFISYGYDNNGVVIDLQSWANPYGDRNLEEEPRLQYETTRRLHDEAEAALLQGKLPSKPDIQQLLKTEGEYKE